MIRIILYFIINIACFYLMDRFFPSVSIKSWASTAIFLVVLAAINWSVVPIIKFLTAPLNFLTLGLLGIIINIIALASAVNLSGAFVINASGVRYLIILAVISFTLSIAQGITNKLTE